MIRKERNLTLDIARAICIILVVAGHYFPLDSPKWWKVVNDFIFSFHMPLFLFLSGYVFMLTWKKESFSDFYVKKIKRLFVPYLVVSILVTTLKLISQINGLNVECKVDYFSFLKIFYEPAAAEYLWFIWVLMWLFLVTFFLKSRNSRLIIFIFSLIIYFIPIQLPSVFCINELPRRSVFFFLGILTFEYKGFMKYKDAFLWLGTILFIILFILKEINSISSLVMLMTLSVLGIICLLFLSEQILKLNIKSTFLFYIAEASFSIYLLHSTFVGLLKVGFSKLENIININIFFSLKAFLIITIATIIPLLFHFYIIKKYRIFSFLFGVKYIVRKK